MTDNQKYFLAVAEELNISKTAEKLFISQQCLSKHIQRIEETYHTKLFERKPKLSLTPAGKAVRQALYQIHLIETGLADELNEMNKNQHGTINLGIARARTSMLIPDIIKKYNHSFPNVKVALYHDYTEKLEAQVVNGIQDIFIGVENAQHSTLNYELLLEERIFMVISNNLLRAFFQDHEECIEASLGGVDLRRFQNVPFVLNTNEEGLYGYINELTHSLGAKINILFQSDDPPTRMRLCQSDFCASFFPEMTLQSVLDTSLKSDGIEGLHFFPLSQSCSNFRLVLAYHRTTFLPEYRKQFIRIAIEVANQYKSNIKPC